MTYRIMKPLWRFVIGLFGKPASALWIEDHLIKERIQEGVTVDRLLEFRAGNVRSEKSVCDPKFRKTYYRVHKETMVLRKCPHI